MYRKKRKKTTTTISSTICSGSNKTIKNWKENKSVDKFEPE